MNTQNKKGISTREAAVFALLGALMFCTKFAMEFLPNIHLVGVLTVTYTLVFRKKALIPIYVYVLIDGVRLGFSVWWVPYLYIWTLLWAGTMLIPKNASKKVLYFVCPIICLLHGLLFGVLYAPAYAIMMKLTMKSAIIWVMNGLPFDLLHGAGNLLLGLLIVPLAEVLRKLTKNI